MAWFIIPLYALTVPLIIIMLIVIAGMLLRPKRRRSSATPSVSVIIPAHNEEDDLPATLASLHEQRYEGELEFVIVNDRSQDRTEEIIREFTERDPRFKLINITEPNKRMAPKVNAVKTGIAHSTGEVILTSDSDCQYHPHWVRAMVSHFTKDVAMVVGYVGTSYHPKNLVAKFETTDWFALMLVSRSLTRFGWKFASSANNQGYTREAFNAIGGFGGAGRAPSGDEDLLTQRMGKLPNKRTVFASDPECQVTTQPMGSLSAFLKQRRRWVSRYHHTLHYHPGFLASIASLGFGNILLASGILASPFNTDLATWVFGLWAVMLAVMMVGIFIGSRQLKRPDLFGFMGFNCLRWAILYPFFIGFIVIRSLQKSAEWKAGARSYRRRYYKRQIREMKRKFIPQL